MGDERQGCGGTAAERRFPKCRGGGRRTRGEVRWGGCQGRRWAVPRRAAACLHGYARRARRPPWGDTNSPPMLCVCVAVSGCDGAPGCDVAVLVLVRLLSLLFLLLFFSIRVLHLPFPRSLPPSPPPPPPFLLGRPEFYDLDVQLACDALAALQAAGKCALFSSDASDDLVRCRASPRGGGRGTGGGGRVRRHWQRRWPARPLRRRSLAGRRRGGGGRGLRDGVWEGEGEGACASAWRQCVPCQRVSSRAGCRLLSRREAVAATTPAPPVEHERRRH